MSSLNDLTYNALGNLGYGGALADRLRAFERDNNLKGNDSWNRFLAESGYTQGSLNDKKYSFFRDGGVLSRWERVLVIGDSWANDNGDYPKWVTAAPVMCEGTSNWTNCDRNEAVAGRRVDEMRTNLTSMLAAHPTIDSVIINGGTNDFSAGRTAFNVFLDMQAIIQEVQTQPNIRDMIVINCPPIKGNAGYTAAKQAEIDTYNSDGTENLEELGVWIVDVYGLVEGTGAEEDTIRFEYGQSYPADPRTDWIHINQDTARDVLAPLIDATILQAKAGAPWRGQLTAYETALALNGVVLMDENGNDLI